MKILIAYYSLEGNTKKAADEIAGNAKAAGADVELLRIEPKEEIVCKGLFGMLKYGHRAMRADCPKLAPISVGIEDFDEIWLGTPVWAGRPATPVNTFIRDYPVADKVTKIFTTSKSGDDKSCIAGLKKRLPNVAETETRKS